MLVGRAAELERLELALTDALAGRAATLVLSGEPGVGKTTLLEAAAERARELGLRVVQVTGVQAERDVPYAGLHALLTQLPGVVPEHLTPAQHEALQVAFGEVEGPAPGRLLLGSAVLAALGSGGPLLVAVDDLPWLDPPSADAVCFAARRLLAEPVALLATQRTTEYHDPLAPTAGLPILRIRGIEDGARLLPNVHATVAQRLAEEYGGNPLAMIESAARLSRAEAAGEVPLSRPLPDSTPERLYAEELAGMSEGERQALRIVALAGRAPQWVLLASLGLAGLDPKDLAPLSQRRLGELGHSGVTWRHPLTRAAAARGTAVEARAAHAALAAAWGTPAGARAAWHLAEAADGPDDAAAEAMARAAADADARSAAADAADAWEYAVRLTTDPALGTSWMENAAAAALRSGATRRASRILDEALQRQPGPEQAAALMRQRGRIEHALGSPDRALQLFVQSHDLTCVRRLKVWAAAEGLFSAMYAADLQDVARMAALARAHHDPTDPVQAFLAAHASGAAAALAGDLEAARTHMELARGLLDGGLLHREPELLLWVVTIDLFDPVQGQLLPEVAAVLDEARRAEDMTFLPRVLRLLGIRSLDSGRLADAPTLFDEAELMSRASGQVTQLAEALVQLGLLDAYQGRSKDALHRADEAETLVDGLSLAWLDSGVAELRALDALTRGDLTAAIPRLREASAGDPFAIVLLADALVRTHGSREARQDPLLATALPPDLGSALAAVLDEDDVAAGSTLCLCAARRPRATQAALLRVLAGERLRRGGRRREARSQLREARATFAALAAAPWLARVDTELRASGATLRKVREDAALTPSERRVAELAAEGLTNKEIAVALYLSPKTVEFHLGHAFRKLGVSNRTALSRNLINGPVGHPRAPG